MVMADAPVVTVQDLDYWYPGIVEPALREVDLDLGRGQFILLVGASGSGKSTLLRTLNGLVPRYHGGRYRGRVEVEGLIASERPTSELAKSVGLVFQDPERQAVMSRVDNEVAFGLECLGVPPEEITDRVHQALGAVGLADRASDMVSELSSGQAQRLALASVLAMEPQVLALDEPTSQLDPEVAEEFFSHLDRERRRRGATVIMAEHRLERGLSLADRVVTMEDGRVVFDGTPAEFLVSACSKGNGTVHTTLTEVFCGMPSPPMDEAGAGELLKMLRDRGDVRFRRRRPPASGEPIVRIEGLSFSYEPGNEVLRGVDLELRPGEVLALVGPNGSGKTTLARHLNGLLRPREGRLLIDGVDANRSSVTELASDVALLTQNPGDYLFERTAEAELRLTASYRGLGDDDTEREIASAVEELGLEGFMDRFSWDLSAGQRQRVALGALLVGAPKVLVLDEPTRGMDTIHKTSLAALARRQAERGKAVLIITHDMEFAARAADRYAVLEDGIIIVEGPPGKVFRRRGVYAPILWRVADHLDLPDDERPISPDDVAFEGSPGGGGAPW
jgi:energy-coupling factor transport system ATP-binding protein